jgi:hypothetical protein
MACLRLASSIERRNGARGHKNQRVFRNAVEDQRSDQRVEEAAHHSAERHEEIELGEVLRGRPLRCQASMTHQGHGCEHREMERDVELDRQNRIRCDEDGHHRRQQRNPAFRRRGGLTSSALPERDHECGEVQRQRNDPYQRHRRDVRGDVRRHTEHQARWDERKRYPSNALRWSDRGRQ